MFELKNKTILVLSPQAWGKMFLSKHHYAVELAKRGNKVYFLNPPEQTNEKAIRGIEIEASPYPDLQLINHRLPFPYRIKFHSKPLFHWLMNFHIRKLLTRIGQPVDIVWSFDLGHLYPLQYFGNKPIKIYHPVDEPLHKEAIEAARGAQAIFSVTKEILDKYSDFNVPKFLVNHGVSDQFISLNDTRDYVCNEPFHVGLSGNLLRPDIDRETLLAIVSEHHSVVFDFWGSYQISDSNIGGSVSQETIDFVKGLKEFPNVKLHGAVKPAVLAEEIRTMDLFLICYDIQKDQSRGTNYHKVMEYLGTGRVVVSNNITTYADRPDLVQMVEERDTNRNLPALFRQIISMLADVNSRKLAHQRISFAQSNSYSNHLRSFERAINTIVS